jgi:hypothetical protein
MSVYWCEMPTRPNLTLYTSASLVWCVGASRCYDVQSRNQIAHMPQR